MSRPVSLEVWISSAVLYSRAMAKAPVREDTTKDTKETESRVTLPIDDKGLLDVERMQGRSKERVREWLSNPSVIAKLGIVTPPSAPASHASADVLPDALIHSLVNTIGQLSSAVIEKVYGCTPEQAVLMQFTPSERDAITPPLKTVLNKYGSTVLLKYGDEIALVAILGSTIANKAGQVQRAMIRDLAPRSAVSVSELSEVVKMD